MLEAKGYNGEVMFDGQIVAIRRPGLLGRLTVGKGEKRLPVHTVTAVQLKPAGPMVNGFIQFTIPGGNEVRSGFGSQTIDAGGDENSVIFRPKQQPAFEALRQAVEAAIVARYTRTAPPVDVADQLTRLAALLDQGVLTMEEFTAQKARLLS